VLVFNGAGLACATVGIWLSGVGASFPTESLAWLGAAGALMVVAAFARRWYRRPTTG